MPVPNPQATIDKTADFYLNQGVLGATCVLLLLLLTACGVVIWLQSRRIARLGDVTLSDREKLIAALEGVRAGEDRDREILQGLQRTLETRTQTLGDLSKQVEITNTDVRHGFNNMTAASNAIAEMLREIRDWLLRYLDRRRSAKAEDREDAS